MKTIGDIIDEQSRIAMKEVEKLEKLLRLSESIISSNEGHKAISKRWKLKIWEIKKSLSPVVDTDYGITEGWMIDNALSKYYDKNRNFLVHKAGKIINQFGNIL